MSFNHSLTKKASARFMVLLAVLTLSSQLGATDTGSVLPNNNTADGAGVLVNLTTGTGNTGIGSYPLNHDTSGSNNTAEGFHALFTNTTGKSNTANGVNALYGNTSGPQNTASGMNALRTNTTGSSNTATGFETLFKNNGNFNTATGYHALYANTSGNFNTATGHQALASNTSGTGNTATGVNALVFNTTASNVTAFGDSALYSNTAGGANSAVGFRALYSNTIGNYNTAVGFGALWNTVDGGYNAAFGALALHSNIDGTSNTAVGGEALWSNVSGYANTAIGEGAGYHLTGNRNVCIGADVVGVAGESNTTRIRNIGITPISSNYLTVVVENNGTKLGYLSSSRRYKKEIAPMEKSSEALLQLKPVTYRAKDDSDPRHAKSYGLIAEEVAEVAPDLVAFNRDGEPETVRYEAVNAMLLNEFLKEHRKVEDQGKTIVELRSTIAQQQKEMREFAAQLQKVSARIELRETEKQIAATKD